MHGLVLRLQGPLALSVLNQGSSMVISFPERFLDVYENWGTALITDGDWVTTFVLSALLVLRSC